MENVDFAQNSPQRPTFFARLFLIPMKIPNRWHIKNTRVFKYILTPFPLFHIPKNGQFQNTL